MSDQFEAATACPHCSEIATHWLRPPDPTHTGARPLRTLPDGTEIHVWGGTLNETLYQVIRTCRRCGRDWGQL